MMWLTTSCACAGEGQILEACPDLDVAGIGEALQFAVDERIRSHCFTNEKWVWMIRQPVWPSRNTSVAFHRLESEPFWVVSW
jgi:hypothetical protein